MIKHMSLGKRPLNELIPILYKDWIQVSPGVVFLEEFTTAFKITKTLSFKKQLLQTASTVNSVRRLSELAASSPNRLPRELNSGGFFSIAFKQLKGKQTYPEALPNRKENIVADFVQD